MGWWIVKKCQMSSKRFEEFARITKVLWERHENRAKNKYFNYKTWNVANELVKPGWIQAHFFCYFFFPNKFYNPFVICKKFEINLAPVLSGDSRAAMHHVLSFQTSNRANNQAHEFVSKRLCCSFLFTVAFLSLLGG